MTRLYTSQKIAAGVPLTLSWNQTHYLCNVLRLDIGKQVSLFNGHDGEWRALIQNIEKKYAVLLPEALIRPQINEPGPWLLFAPLKKTCTDFIVQKATELGVEVIWPLFTRNTSVHRVNLKRLQLNIAEAAEQCERLTLPEIRNPISLDALPDMWPTCRPLWVADETGGGLPVGMVAKNSDASKPPGILTGPEGGFDTVELDLLSQLSFVSRITLGPRILRAETAAIAVLACWQATSGNWV